MTKDNGTPALLSKWLIVNALWVSLAGAAWHQGWLQYIFEKDLSYISHGLAVIFALVLIQSFWKTLQQSRLFKSLPHLRTEFEAVPDREDARDALRTELMASVSFIEFCATSLLAAGVIGTVIGLIMGFANVDPATLSNVANAGATVAEVLKGLSVAFHTTLVGGIANLWLRMNHYMLVQGNGYLYARVLRG